MLELSVMFQHVDVVVQNAIKQVAWNALLELMDMLVMEFVKVWKVTEFDRMFCIAHGSCESLPCFVIKYFLIYQANQKYQLTHMDFSHDYFRT